MQKNKRWEASSILELDGLEKREIFIIYDLVKIYMLLTLGEIGHLLFNSVR